MSVSIPWQNYRPLARALCEQWLHAPPGTPEIVVTAPWTGEVVGHVPRFGSAQVVDAVRRARAAQPRWAALPYAVRQRVLLRFHDLLLARQRTVLDLMQIETGKARRHALEEVFDTAIVARHYAYHGKRLLQAQRRKGALPFLTRCWEEYHPLGVVGIIAPWNYPLTLAITDAIPALLAGNAVVLKPDSQSPFTALWVADVLREAGLPRDVLHLVTGPGAEVGTALIDTVDYVTFTGSTATGREVARRAAERMIGCSLELGGKNALIVLDDANLQGAVSGAVRGCFASAGQLCVSIERIFVHERVYNQFVGMFGARVRGLRPGAGFGFDIDMGSLISAQQLAVVRAHVEDAVSHGAHVLAGGKPRPDLGPFFYEPTVLVGVTPAMKLYDEETFGPVVAVYPVASAEEAIARTNSSRYGLNASIWTRNHARGRALAAQLQAGTVNVNEVYAAAWASVDAPMGGFKDSGLGRRHGVEGILKYTQSQTVAVQRFMPLAAPRGVPDSLYARIITAWLRAIRIIPGLR